MESVLKWHHQKGRFANGHDGMAGTIKLFSVMWDSSSSRDIPEKYKLIAFLPGFKSVLGNFVSLGEAQDRAEQTLAYWLKKTGLANG